MGKILFLTLFAGSAGLLGWALSEPFAPGTMDAAWSRWEIMFVIITGGSIGAAIGGFGGWLQGSRAHLLRGLVGGLALGALGGYLGYQIGGFLAFAIFGPDIFAPKVGAGLLVDIRVVLARVVVFIPFGACIGAVHGIGARSLARTVQGAIGGMIGGAIGGAVFDVIGSLLTPMILAARQEQFGEVGTASRAVAMTIIGGAVGLLVGIVEILSRKAWVRLELGRNEGKEWIVDAAQTFIGRSENAHIPLFGDPNVMPMHACIVRSRGQYQLLDGGSAIGIGINGIRIPEAILNHGDVINIGNFGLRFSLRHGKAVAPRPVPQVVTAAPPPVFSSPPAKTYALVATDGPMIGSRFPLNSGEVIAGREAAGLNLAFDGSASRQHAAFIASPSGVLVRDLGSTNGTLVNGVRVQEMSLRPGDVVKIGSTSFRLE